MAPAGVRDMEGALMVNQVGADVDTEVASEGDNLMRQTTATKRHSSLVIVSVTALMLGLAGVALFKVKGTANMQEAKPQKSTQLHESDEFTITETHDINLVSKEKWDFSQRVIVYANLGGQGPDSPPYTGVGGNNGQGDMYIIVNNFDKVGGHGVYLNISLVDDPKCPRKKDDDGKWSYPCYVADYSKPGNRVNVSDNMVSINMRPGTSWNGTNMEMRLNLEFYTNATSPPTPVKLPNALFNIWDIDKRVYWNKETKEKIDWNERLTIGGWEDILHHTVENLTFIHMEDLASDSGHGHEEQVKSVLKGTDKDNNQSNKEAIFLFYDVDKVRMRYNYGSNASVAPKSGCNMLFNFSGDPPVCQPWELDFNNAVTKNDTDGKEMNTFSVQQPEGDDPRKWHITNFTRGVDLIIESVGDLRTHGLKNGKPMNKWLTGDDGNRLVQLNLRSDAPNQEGTWRWSFIDSITGKPVEMEKLTMHVYDMDGNEPDNAEEDISASGVDTVDPAETTESVDVDNSGGTVKVTALKYGTVDDNYETATGVDLSFTHTDHVELTFHYPWPKKKQTASKPSKLVGRNFLFRFTELGCVTESHPHYHPDRRLWAPMKTTPVE